MKLEDLQIHQLSMDLGEKVWQIVDKWNYFSKDTIRKQLVRAADSISANLSEGFGRFHFKENKQFCYYSRGSLYETKTWLKKAHNRGLLLNDAHSTLQNEIETIAIKLNKYINTIGKK